MKTFLRKVATYAAAAGLFYGGVWVVDRAISPAQAQVLPSGPQALGDVNSFVRGLNGAPDYLGRLTSGGLKITNGMLGTPFTTARGNLLLVQCDATAHILPVSTSTGAVTTTTGVKIRTTDNFYVTMPPWMSTPYIGMIPDSGSANCDVWRMRAGTTWTP